METGQKKQGVLYLCGTPIGNLGDITLRALETLRQADIIICEDTRRTLKLLSHYRVKPSRLMSYHQFSSAKKIDDLLKLPAQGKDLVYVTDAGMPGISDPGFKLTREARDRGIQVIALPGPSAVTAALAVSGFPADRFLFWGFLNRNPKKRREELEKLSMIEETVVLFESPHRLLKTLSELYAHVGSRETIVVRELTKKYEEVCHGALNEHLHRFQQIPPRGEFVLVLGCSPGQTQPALPSEAAIREDLIKLTRVGISPNKAVRTVSLLRGVPRNKVYAISLNLKKRSHNS